MSETTEAPAKPSIYDFLKQFPGAPDKAQIESWNKMVPNGSVRVFPLPDQKRVFIIRALTALELTALQIDAQKHAPEKQAYELQVATAVKATLWTNITATGKLAADDLRTAGAGLAGTLQTVILDKSDFVDPQVLDSFIVDL